MTVEGPGCPRTGCMGASRRPMRRGLRQAVRSTIRDLAASTLARTGALAPARRARGELTIVTFHRVLPEAERRAYPHPGLAVTPDELRWLGAYFAEHFAVGTLTEHVRRLNERVSTPKPLLSITFDDGQLDNFVFGRPVLDELDLRATFFVPVDHIASGAALWHDRMGFALLRALGDAGAHATLEREGFVSAASLRDEPHAVVAQVTSQAKDRSPAEREEWIARLESIAGATPLPEWAGMMTWEHLRLLAEDGHEIGSHSRTHPLLPQCDETTVVEEVAGSRRILRAELGVPVESFCYPNGDYDDRSRRAVQSAGYVCGVVTRWGRNPPASDPYTLLRCDMHPDHVRDRHGRLSAARLSLRLSGLQRSLA